MESLKQTNIATYAETTDNAEVKKSLSGANSENDKCDDSENDECDHMSSLETLHEDNSTSMSHVMLLRPNSEGIVPVQGGKGCVSPEKEAMQSPKETNGAIDAETVDNNEVKGQLLGAKQQIDKSEHTSSSETLNKDSCTSVMLLGPTTQGNDPSQGGKGRVPPEKEAMQSLKETNIATDAEAADTNEVKEPLSSAGSTTQANGFNQTGKRCLPPLTELLPSSMKANIDADAKTIHSNESNKPLSNAGKENYQCDETSPSEILPMDSSSPVLTGMSTEANGLIHTGKNSVPHEVEPLQSPETMNVTIDSKTKDLNIQVNGSIERGKNRVPQKFESFETRMKTNIDVNTDNMDSNKVNKSLLENDERNMEEAIQQTQNDDAKSECYVMDHGSVATLGEDHTCRFARREDVKPVNTEATKNRTNTTESGAAPMIVSPALECVSIAMPVHASGKGDPEEQIYATLYGQCIGDAIGLLTEFMSKADALINYGDKSELEYAYKIKDRHRKRWKNGDWTDDSDQMILIMQSLVAKGGVVNPNDFASRLVKWMNEGFHELDDDGGVGIGHTTYITINTKGFEANPHKISKQVWERSGHFLAPNGGVMRTSILGIHAWWDTHQVYRNAIDICKTTHFDPRCQASAVSVCVAISFMLQRKEQHYKNGEYIIQTIIEDVFEVAASCLEKEEEKKELWRYLQCRDLSELQLDEVSSIGYTYKCLGAGFWALKKCDFRKALQDIAMCGGDADTNGAVAGALLGCKLGSRKCFPKSWLELKHKDWLDTQIQTYLKVLKKEQEEWNKRNKFDKNR